MITQEHREYIAKYCGEKIEYLDSLEQPHRWMLDYLNEHGLKQYSITKKKSQYVVCFDFDDDEFAICSSDVLSEAICDTFVKVCKGFERRKEYFEWLSTVDLNE